MSSNESENEQQLIINTNPMETRIALMEDGEVAELFIERYGDHGLVGNIYKGVITRVLPGMNSAFVDIGLSRSAFLFGGDVIDPEEDLQASRSLEELDDEPRPRINKRPIEQILHEGQQIVVQISKEPLGSKGPRITMYITVPGRYLVLMPRYAHIGVSRRIENEEERNRLRQAVSEIAADDVGVIIRTAALGVDEALLKQDLIFLTKVWNKVSRNLNLSKAPSLLYSDLDIIKKTTRDLYSEQVSKIIIDDRDVYKELQDFLYDMIPSAVAKLELYSDRTPIFDVFGVEIDLAKALATRVELPSGGYLVIDQTEALTSFDVNTGRFVGKMNARQTILKTNLEAAKKVVEQLRIRNIGGIIIVDFIDMDEAQDREGVYNLLQEELKGDRARTNVLRISELGLIQMTRKRTSESLGHQLLSACPMCEGKGETRSVTTESLDLVRELVRSALQTGQKKLIVKVRPDIQAFLLNHRIDLLSPVKREYGIDIEFVPTQLNAEIIREPAFEVLSEK